MVTELIIGKLESGTIQWRKPWSDYGPAVNYLSKKPYRGINQLILNGLHAKPFYLTFNQATSADGRIKKGAKSIPIVYWNFVYHHVETKRKITDSDIAMYPAHLIVITAFMKYYRVFNVDDILNADFDIPELHVQNEHHSIDLCDKLLSNMKDRPKIRHQENSAFYNPIQDYINMPPIEYFKTFELYYSVLHHELIHSTGHVKRLNRFESDEISNFNSTSYSKEELVAEIGATFLNSQCGILNDDTITDSSAYIQGWLNKLRNDKKFIVEASAKAQKAVDYILNKGV